MRAAAVSPLLVAALAALCWAPGAARADALVKACALDGAYGEGTTLREALAIGGVIRFDCPPGTVMKVVGHYGLTKPVEIDGAGAITLDGGGAPGTFLVSQLPLTLRGLTLRNFESAVFLSAGTIADCQFATNSAVAVDASEPLGPVNVLRTTFTGNRGSVLRLSQQAHDPAARVSVRASVFRDNDGGAAAGAIEVRDLVPLARDVNHSPQPIVDAVARLPPGHFDFAYNLFQGNRGSKAGALSADLGRAELTSVGDLFVDNTSSGDGGAIAIASGTATFTHSLFKGDKAGGRGAAVFVAPQAHATLANALVIGAAGPSAAVEGSGLTLANVTIAANLAAGLTAPDGGRIGNTLLARNTRGDCAATPASAFQGRNFASDRSCPGTTTRDAGLDGFFVPTDARTLTGGDAAICRAPPTAGVDLAFQARSDPAQCALGAFERAPTEPFARGGKPPDVHATTADVFTEADGYKPPTGSTAASPPPIGSTTSIPPPRPDPVPEDRLFAALAGLGIDYSVDEAMLRGWLKNPTYTPYPAIAQALVALLRPRPLRQPVYIDVIVKNYEDAPGARSPRKVGDVDVATLKQAVLEGYNYRHQPHGRTFEDILR